MIDSAAAEYRTRSVPVSTRAAEAARPASPQPLSSPQIILEPTPSPNSSSTLPRFHHAVVRTDPHVVRWAALACHDHQEVRPSAHSPGRALVAHRRPHGDRLEATTSRLEDLASLATSYLPPSAQGSAAVPAPANANANAEPTPVPPPAPHAPPAPAPVSAGPPKSITDFDKMVIEGQLKPFVELTRSFAIPSVVEQVRSPFPSIDPRCH